jgi:hypothetical protein
MMDKILEIAIIWGLGLLGMALYAFIEVWKIVKLKDFNPQRFFGENVKFWVICLALNFVISIILIVAPEFKEVLYTLGFAITDDTQSGFILLGFALAAGNDSKLSGSGKTLITKE